MENPIFGPICRTCMTVGQNFHSILESESVGKLRINEMLMATVPQLHIQSGTDKLPMLICAECLNQLNIAYHYQQLCIQTDKSLKAMLVLDEDADGEKQQEVVHLNIEAKQIEILWPKEFTTDPLVHDGDTLLPLHDSSIKIENDTECEEFLCNDEDDKKGIFKITTMDTATLGTDVIGCVSSDHNETCVDKIEKPNFRYRKGLFPCPDCPKLCDRPYQLRRHSIVHSITRLYQCDICKYRFATEILLNRHKTTHNTTVSVNIEVAPPDGYKCPDCPRRFERNSSLSAHLRSHRRENPDSIFQCEYCPKQFSKFRRLTQHARVHPENHKFKCHLCEKTFALNSRLRTHLEKHSGLKKFACIHCAKTFRTNPSLKEHMNTHTGEKPHLCPHCGKSFKQRTVLCEHVKRHSNERHFRCHECSSKFFCSSDLSKHMSVHSTSKSHTCDVCGSSFTRSYTLSKHKKIKHKHMGERPYKCVECNMGFFIVGSLQRHMRTHTGQKPYKCKYCDRAYSASGDLNKHLRSHVGENTYMCDECPKAFKYKKELQLHKIQHFKQTELQATTVAAAVVEESPAVTPTTIEVVLTTTEGKTTASIGTVV